MKVSVEISARHIHLAKPELEKLFGRGYQLSKSRSLSLPGEFAAKETVSLINGSKRFEGVRIVGPLRKKTQVELSLTDTFKLGIRPALRLSGNIKGTPGIIVEGPKGKVNLKQGVIVALRHLHLSPAKAKELGLRHESRIELEMPGKRALSFSQIWVRISEEKSDFDPIVHLDTDEGNACGLKQKGKGSLII